MAGSPEIVRLLLSNHASVNLGDENNVIPLHTASSLGYMDIARMLLESGIHVMQAKLLPTQI